MQKATTKAIASDIIGVIGFLILKSNNVFKVELLDKFMFKLDWLIKFFTMNTEGIYASKLIVKLETNIPTNRTTISNIALLPSFKIADKIQKNIANGRMKRIKSFIRLLTENIADFI